MLSIAVTVWRQQQRTVPALVMTTALITVSIVSHGQGRLVNALLADLRRHCRGISLVLTENIPEEEPLRIDGWAGAVDRITNERVKGFGANHNAAFQRCSTPYFCVANPDVRLSSDPFPALVSSLQGPRAAVAGPLVRSPAGGIEDSARRFPTPASIVRRVVRGDSGPDYPVDRGPLVVEWIAGMFMLFRAATYRDLGGFDEAYFMYYEDVDLCRRAGRAGGEVIYNPGAQIVHDARRASRHNPRLAYHHALSALRFLLSR